MLQSNIKQPHPSFAGHSTAPPPPTQYPETNSCRFRSSTAGSKVALRACGRKCRWDILRNVLIPSPFLVTSVLWYATITTAYGKVPQQTRPSPLLSVAGLLMALLALMGFFHNPPFQPDLGTACALRRKQCACTSTCNSLASWDLRTFSVGAVEDKMCDSCCHVLSRTACQVLVYPAHIVAFVSSLFLCSSPVLNLFQKKYKKKS